MNYFAMPHFGDVQRCLASSPSANTRFATSSLIMPLPGVGV
jgi:hypothetical protein